MNRQYGPGEKPHSIFSNYHGSNKFNQYFYVKMGIIEEIDIDKFEMVVRWQGSDGVRSQVPISFPYMGPSGCIAARTLERSVRAVRRSRRAVRQSKRGRVRPSSRLGS